MCVCVIKVTRQVASADISIAAEKNCHDGAGLSRKRTNLNGELEA